MESAFHGSNPVIGKWQHDSETELRFSFVSDLHCFSSRSSYDQHERMIAEVIDRNDVCVWGGDLFDFRWSQVGEESESIAAALDWLQRQYENHPSKRFIFLRGNHDGHFRFSDRLQQWSESRDRFSTGLDALVVGDTMFVHGDVIEGGGSNQAFASYRRTWQDKPVAHPRASTFYDAVISTRIHRAVAMTAHRRRRTCLQLVRWIHRQDTELMQSVRRVVFGHTHRRIENYRLHGYEFYNGGAAIKHVGFKPVELICVPDATVQPD